jgi:nucleotide-binding universal stress UspA family protein
MYDTILVPTDGSDAAKKAVEGGIALAERFDASLHSIYVVKSNDYPQQVRSELSTEAFQQGNAILDEITSLRDQTAVDITTQVIETEAQVHQEIIDYGTDHNVDLILMGTHGRTGLNHLILGSIAERTLRVSPIPVLTVHRKTTIDPNIEKILVPTDGSETASKAAAHAIQIAAMTNGTLHIVHVVDLTAFSGEYGSGSVLNALEATGQQAVDTIIEHATEADIQSVEASVLSGSPSRAITDYATDRDIDLVVMGTHGRSSLDRLLIGSVTEKVVRLAKMPVLSVAPQNRGA